MHLCFLQKTSVRRGMRRIYISMLFPTWVYVKACADSKNHKKHKKQKETYTGFVCLKRTRGAPGPVRGIFGCAPGVRRQQKKHVPEIWISIGFLQVRKRRRAKFSLKIRCAPRYPPHIYIYMAFRLFFPWVYAEMYATHI